MILDIDVDAEEEEQGFVFAGAGATMTARGDSRHARRFSDAVHAIVTRIAAAGVEQPRSGESPASAMTTAEKKRGATATATATGSDGRGPLLLTTEEIKTLLLLAAEGEARDCYAAAAAAAAAPSSSSSPYPSLGRSPVGFASVEGEELANLVESLELHARLAYASGPRGGRIVDAALKAWKDGGGAHLSPTQASKALGKVSPSANDLRRTMHKAA
jgi:hypothetical protein